MKLATWNIERLKHRLQLNQMVEQLNRVEADILILTEADQRLKLPQYKHVLNSAALESPYYAATEYRSIIYSNYRLIGTESTYDAQTALCAVFETPRGPLAVYGTIVGIHGNRRPSFMEELQKQLADIDRISSKMPFALQAILTSHSPIITTTPSRAAMS